MIVVKGELIHDGRAIIEGVPANIVEELEYAHTGDDQVLDGSGVVQVVDVSADEFCSYVGHFGLNLKNS